MSDRLHEIIAQIGVLHKDLLNSNKINDLLYVEETLKKYDTDVQEHYYGLLMQYYFQQNNLKNLQELLLEGFKFDLRFEDIKEAFIHIKEDEDNVIEFFEDSVVMLKDVVTDNLLEEMYRYYEKHENYQHYLEDALSFIKKNRYICAHAYQSKEDFATFFINEDLLESLKRDLPYLFK